MKAKLKEEQFIVDVWDKGFEGGRGVPTSRRA